MAHLYIQPPTKEEIVYQFADWIARLFRVQVTVTLDSLTGSKHTVEIAHPDRPEPVPVSEISGGVGCGYCHKKYRNMDELSRHKCFTR